MLGLKTFLKNDDRTHTQTDINMSLFKRAGVSVAVKETGKIFWSIWDSGGVEIDRR